MNEFTIIKSYNFFVLFGFDKSKPKGLVGKGAITVTLLIFDKKFAISSDSFADTTGSGGKTADIISIFFILV